ncbi:hypothetical protein AAHC03_0914 [Spirometra sp. Aus1]
MSYQVMLSYWDFVLDVNLCFAAGVLDRASLHAASCEELEFVFPSSSNRLIVKKAIQTLRYRRQPVCLHFIRTGTCRNNDSCRFSHAADHVKICPKFLSHTCRLGEAKCPLAHVLDPCRIPQCDFFAKGDCKRESCPYLHVKYAEDTVSCPSFLNGRCELAQKCTKRHVWPAVPRRKPKSRGPADHPEKAQTSVSAVVATRLSSPLEKAPEVYKTPCLACRSTKEAQKPRASGSP